MFLPGRVIRLLTRPGAEWAAIAAEPDNVASICQGYVAILALVPAASTLAGIIVAGGRFLGAAGLMTAIIAAIVSWAMAIGSSIACASIIEKIAPAFESDGDLTQAFKLVGYAQTPAWLVGALFLFGPSEPIAIVGGIWAVYLGFRGLPTVMKTPRPRVAPFLGAATLAFLLVSAVLRALFAAFKVPYLSY